MMDQLLFLGKCQNFKSLLLSMKFVNREVAWDDLNITTFASALAGSDFSQPLLNSFFYGTWIYFS